MCLWTLMISWCLLHAGACGTRTCITDMRRAKGFKMRKGHHRKRERERERKNNCYFSRVTGAKILHHESKKHTKSKLKYQIDCSRKTFIRPFDLLWFWFPETKLLLLLLLQLLCFFSLTLLISRKCTCVRACMHACAANFANSVSLSLCFPLSLPLRKCQKCLFKSSHFYDMHACAKTLRELNMVLPLFLQNRQTANGSSSSCS